MAPEIAPKTVKRRLDFGDVKTMSEIVILNWLEAMLRERKENEAGLRLANIRADFIASTYTIYEILAHLRMGGEFVLRTSCVDERVVDEHDPQIRENILEGKLSLPGGGFDALSRERILDILEITHGKIKLRPHWACGWAAARMKSYDGIEERITQAIPGTTMVVEDGLEFQNGKHYVNHIINKATNDKHFCEFLEREEHVLNDSRLGQPVYLRKELEQRDDLRTFAFAYGKMLELKELFEQVAKENQIKDVEVKIVPDMLIDAPDVHVAQAVVVKMTKRVRKGRFELPGLDFPQPFFVGVDDPDSLPGLVGFLRGIMDGHHSRTVGLQREVHVFCENEEQKLKIEKLLRFEEQDIHVYIHIVADNER